jgi:hypothetical protein
MVPRVVHTVTCTLPIETKEGTALISVSNKNSELLSQYPLAEVLIGDYCRSREFKDFVAEGRDVCTDLKVFETGTVGQKTKRSDLLSEDPLDVERATRILSSPVESFRVAQIWARGRHKRINRFSPAFRESFFAKLKSLVPEECADQWSECYPATRLRALDAFLEVTNTLLKQWRKAGKIDHR